MINYSIIIPHKNIPNLLQRCLDSIPNREDVQIIVVDDNSDPNIVDFDKFPGLNRSNVEVIFTKEGIIFNHFFSLSSIFFSQSKLAASFFLL